MREPSKFRKVWGGGGARFKFVLKSVTKSGVQMYFLLVSASRKPDLVACNYQKRRLGEHRPVCA